MISKKPIFQTFSILIILFLTGVTPVQGKSPAAPTQTGLELALNTTGSISGTVYEANGVTPIANVFVAPFGENYFAQGECTDNLGNYTIHNVPFGLPVYVHAGGSWWCGENNYALEFWQESSSLNNASLLTTSAQTPDLTGIDFTLDAVSPPASDPFLRAWYAADIIEADNWPLGTHLFLEIEDMSTLASPDYSAEMDVTEPITGFDLRGQFDVKPGMFVIVSGASLTRIVMVDDLNITAINHEADTISGTTAPNNWMWMYFEPSCTPTCRSTVADGSGNWTIDYSVPGPNGEPAANIGPGSTGAIHVPSGNGSTSVEWSVGFQISGRYILDANGNNLVMRGINHGHNWWLDETSSFANIKATEANTVRVVLSNGSSGLWPKDDAADVANVINLCKSNKLICILEVHDTTGYGDDTQMTSLAEAVNYWKEIKSVLIGQEAYVTINIGNEPYGNNNTTGWINDTKNAITEMRTAGFHHLLMVDAPNWGQDWESIMKVNAANILANDPDGNTVFSIHMYGVYDTPEAVESYLSAFVNAGLPLVIGEFGWNHTDGDPDEDAIMSTAQYYGIGYLGWVWSGDDYLDIVKNFDPNQLTGWGNRLIYGTNGIRDTSCEATIYGGSQCFYNFKAWIGGISITSDQNVVTVGRPHLAGEIMTYDGFASGSHTQYVPMLFKDAFGGSYDSALYIQNVDPNNIANITIKFYDTNGVLTYSKSDTITALASKGYWLPGISQLGSSWLGGVKVESDVNIVAVGRPHIGGQVMTYNGFSSGSINVSIPMLFKDAFGGSYDSALYIQNVHSSTTANITIKYYDSNGNLTCSQNDTIAPLASKGYWLPGIACLGSSWVGGVKVESNVNIVAVGRPHIDSQITTYAGFSAGGLSISVPMLFKDAFGGSYDSALYIQNVDPNNTANITIKYYDNSGNLTCSQTDTIAALASKGYWLPGIACLGSSWVGGVKVESNVNIVAVGRPHIGSEVLTYNGFTSGSMTAYVPMMFRHAFGWSYDSALYVQNTNLLTQANVTLKFYNGNGQLTCTKQVSIPAGATSGFWLPSLICD